MNRGGGGSFFADVWEMVGVERKPELHGIARAIQSEEDHAADMGIPPLPRPPEDRGFLRHPNSERFHHILHELGELHDRKQADYGRDDDPFANVRASTEWGVEGWVGAMVRATDKIRRLQSLVANGKLENEPVEDSLRDLAVYAVIALVLYEQSVSPAG